MTVLPEALRHSAAHVFVADLTAPTLTEEDRRHLGAVLRLRDGEVVTLSDGMGAWCPARFRAGGVEPDAAPVDVAMPTPTLTVGFAPPKGDRPEMMVRSLTELGVDVIAPFTSRRSVVRWAPDRADRRHRRLERVAREAAMQSRRVRLPRVMPVVTYAELVGSLAPGSVALADPDGAPLECHRTPTVLIGPEGGWDPEELASVEDRVALGPGVLRCETAAIAAGVLLSAGRHGRAP